MRISDWSSDVCSSDLSYFLIAVMVDGVLQWRMVPRPSPWVLKEKVDAAKARATKQTVAVSNVKVSEAPALPVETAVHTAPETVIIPRLNSIPDLNPSPEISESDRTDRLNVRERSEERRVGKVCVSTCRSRWWPCNKKKKKN